MTDKQDRLDKATRQLDKIIKGLKALADQAGKEADALCHPMQASTCADVRDVEAELLAAASSAVRAYAKGRRLQIPDDGDGLITPFFGGGGKG